MTRPVLKRERRTLAFKCLCASLLGEQLVHPDLLMSLEAIYGPRHCLNTADAGSNWNLDKLYLYLNHRNVYRWVRRRSEMFITLLEQRVSTNSSHCVHFIIVIWHKSEEMKHTVYLKLLLTSISVRWRMLPLAHKLQFVGFVSLEEVVLVWAEMSILTQTTTKFKHFFEFGRFGGMLSDI